MKELYLLLLYNAEGVTLPTGEDFISKVFPNIWAFLVQLIAFIIMVIVVIKLAYKPVHKFIEQRREYVERNIREAEEKNAEANKYLEESKQSIQASQKQAIEIIQSANKEAMKQKEIALEETQKEITAKHSKAQEDLKIEQDKALKELHDDVVDIALEATKTILNREVSKEDDKKLVDDFVKDLMNK